MKHRDTFDLKHGALYGGETLKYARQMQAAAVRLPDDLMRWLRHQAVDNKRSLAGEVHYRLEESRRAQERRAETTQGATA